MGSAARRHTTPSLSSLGLDNFIEGFQGRGEVKDSQSWASMIFDVFNIPLK